MIDDRMIRNIKDLKAGDTLDVVVAKGAEPGRDPIVWLDEDYSVYICPRNEKDEYMAVYNELKHGSIVRVKIIHRRPPDGDKVIYDSLIDMDSTPKKQKKFLNMAHEIQYRFKGQEPSEKELERIEERWRCKC